MTRSKDPSIESLLVRLDLDKRGWTLVDYWDGDLCAIGIASRRDRSRLVYVSTFAKRGAVFDYQCEHAPATADELYRVGREGTDVGFDELLAVLVSHLKG